MFIMINAENLTGNPITKYVISPIKETQNKIVALASATFYDTITVNSITIRKGDNGNLYIRMPNKKTSQGNYIDVAHPLNSQLRRKLNSTLIDAYKSGENRKSLPLTKEPKITAQNAYKFKGENGNCLARVDVVVEDMVVHNCRIFGGENGNISIAMPAYKDKNGDYHSIVTPTSPNRLSQIKEASMTEYNTEYLYRKLSENNLANIRESGISVVVHKNDNYENIVKFKSDDLAKINNIIAQNTVVKK